MIARFFTILALALTLILTGHAMASARGAAAAAGQMVICTGEGVMTVYTDAEGTPTSAPHICPDCVLHAAALTAQPVAGAPSSSASLDGAGKTPHHRRPTAPGIGWHSRAPPLMV